MMFVVYVLELMEEATAVFVVGLELAFDDDGVGIIVGRRIPPVVDTVGFSRLIGGDGSFVGRGG